MKKEAEGATRTELGVSEGDRRRERDEGKGRVERHEAHLTNPRFFLLIKPQASSFLPTNQTHETQAFTRPAISKNESPKTTKKGTPIPFPITRDRRKTRQSAK